MGDNQAQLAFLQSLIGDWSYQFSTADDSDHPGATATGTETVRAVGTNFVFAENVGKGNDASGSHSVTVIGYEPDHALFTGSVAGTAVDQLFVHEGKLSDDGRSLLLQTEGPAMTPGRETDSYRDVLELHDKDCRVTRAEVLVDGEWKEFMRTEYTRMA